jgi:transposase-like protein
MRKNQREIYRYSDCFKEKVVQEISAGSTISEVCRRYDIKGLSTVQNWLKKYGRTELLNTIIRVKMKTEDDKIKQLESENKRLKIALADATLAKDVLEVLIEEVDAHYQTDVKKNFGQKLSTDARRKRGKR